MNPPAVGSAAGQALRAVGDDRSQRRIHPAPARCGEAAVRLLPAVRARPVAGALAAGAGWSAAAQIRRLARSPAMTPARPSRSGRRLRAGLRAVSAAGGEVSAGPRRPAVTLARRRGGRPASRRGTRPDWPKDHSSVRASVRVPTSCIPEGIVVWGLTEGGDPGEMSHGGGADLDPIRKILQIPPTWQTACDRHRQGHAFRPAGYGVGRRDSARIMLPLSATSKSGR